jgi:hypothetical protein
MAGIGQLGLGKTLPAIAPASFAPTETWVQFARAAAQVSAASGSQKQCAESTLDLVCRCLAGGVRIRR